MNSSPLPPKYLNWDLQIDQWYVTPYTKLVTSGCSFTASTIWLEGPASWPGFVKDRCGFLECTDLSFPGAGNEYIANSILSYVESSTVEERAKMLVIVGWSGLDRKENLTSEPGTTVSIDNIHYVREQSSAAEINHKWQKAEVWRSWKNIIMLKNYLENKKVAHGFFSYCNLLEPPFLPKRDRTPEWPNMISEDKLKSLKEIDWVIPASQSLFEFAFETDTLSEDFFHPTDIGIAKWTDSILLPNLAKHGLISLKNS